MYDTPLESEPKGFRRASSSEVVEALTAKYLREERNERQREIRHPLLTRIRLWLNDTSVRECRTTDLSASGIGVFVEEYIEPRTRVRIGFLSLEPRLAVNGQVRHSVLLDGEFHHIGIEFE